MGSGRQCLGLRWGPVLGRRGLQRPFFAFGQSGHLPRGHRHQTVHQRSHPPRAPRLRGRGLGALHHRPTPRQRLTLNSGAGVPVSGSNPQLRSSLGPRVYGSRHATRPRGHACSSTSLTKRPPASPQVGQDGPCIPSGDTLHSPVGTSQPKGESQIPEPPTQPTDSASAPPLSQSLPCP